MKYRINYEKVMSQANQLEQEAEALLQQSRALKQLQSDCRNNWKGEAAEVFQNKLSSMSSEMFRTNLKLIGLVNTIRQCAQQIQKADERAKQRADALKMGQ